MEDFNAAVQKFQAFLIENGCDLEIVWVLREDVLEDERHAWIHSPPPKNNLLKIEEEYKLGMESGFGVILEAYCCTETQIFCIIFIAKDSQTASDLMMSGLKLSIIQNPRTAKLIRRQWVWNMLRLFKHESEGLLASNRPR